MFMRNKTYIYNIIFAQTSPNLKFCFMKRAHRRTLFEGLWMAHWLFLEVDNQIYGS